MMHLERKLIIIIKKRYLHLFLHAAISHYLKFTQNYLIILLVLCVCLVGLHFMLKNKEGYLILIVRVSTALLWVYIYKNVDYICLVGVLFIYLFLSMNIYIIQGIHGLQHKGIEHCFSFLWSYSCLEHWETLDLMDWGFQMWL